MSADEQSCFEQSGISAAAGLQRGRIGSPARNMPAERPNAGVARMTSIFVSYRREDAAGHAGRLCDRLRSQFGRAQVFMDVDTIRPGCDFEAYIETAIASCSVFLALIGHDWLSASDADGRRRIDNNRDYVRLELAAALSRGLLVIPVLVRGAGMPSPADLPEDIKRLTRIEAIELSDTRWEYDISCLIDVLEGNTNEQPATGSVHGESTLPDAGAAIVGRAYRRSRQAASNESRRRFVGFGIAVLVGMALCGTVAFYLLRQPPHPKMSIQASSTAPPAVDAANNVVTYEAARAIDGNPTTAWRTEGDGHGATLSLDLGKRMGVDRVGLLPGYAKIDPFDHRDRFIQNRRITSVRYHFDDGSSRDADFEDKPIVQFADVGIKTRHITIEIVATTPGDPDFDYTAISEIVVVKSPNR